MKNKSTARRYALSLFQLASDNNCIDAVYNELSSIHDLEANSPEFSAFLQNPIIPDMQKKEAMKAIFEKQVRKETMDFLLFICEKDRENILTEMIECFIELRNEKLGLVQAEVFSVSDLSENQIKLLTEKIKTLTGKTPTMSFKKDPSLIGGFLVRIGDTVLDGSVRRQIQRLRSALLN